MSLGEELQVEVGGSVEGVRMGQSGLASHPFMRLTAHPMGTWTLHYRMATDRELQGFEDVTTGQTDVPVALVRNGKLALETGRHQEASVGRKAGGGTVEFAYYHDALQQTMVTGGGAAGPGETQESAIPAGMLVDPTTGSFRALAAGYNDERCAGDGELAADGRVCGWRRSTASGDALMSGTGGTAEFAEALAGLKAQSVAGGDDCA